MRERRTPDERDTHRGLGTMGDLRATIDPPLRRAGLAPSSSICAVMSGSRLWILLLLSVLAVFLGARDLRAQAPGSDVCESALPAAEAQYRDAAYGEALRLVSACLDQSSASTEQSVAAYRLLALIHLKRDELDQARAAVVNLLGVEPTYEADPVTSPPAYVSLVAIVQRDLQSGEAVADESPERRPFFRRAGTWVTIGTIVVGSGVATYFALGSGEEGTGEPVPTPPPAANPLPLPPGTP